MAGDATLTLELAPSNAVTGLALHAPTLTLPAGSAAALAVAVETEDGAPLPPAAAAEGLIVRVLPPGGGRAESQALRLDESSEPHACISCISCSGF